MRLALLAVAAISTGAAAQRPTGGGNSGGSAGRISYDYFYSSQQTGNVQQRWLRAVVLWRRSGDSLPVSPARSRDAERVLRTAERAAEDIGRRWTGGYDGFAVHSLEYDSTWLYILGQQFPFPESDSAVVILVDRIDSIGGRPIITGSYRLSSRMPDSFWPQYLSRGDTALFVHPSNPSLQLFSWVRIHPLGREFLSIAP